MWKGRRHEANFVRGVVGSLLRAPRGVLAVRARCMAARGANGRAEVMARCLGWHVGREVRVEAAVARPAAWPSDIVQCS